MKLKLAIKFFVMYRLFVHTSSHTDGDQQNFEFRKLIYHGYVFIVNIVGLIYYIICAQHFLHENMLDGRMCVRL